ncbi:unnamed protein product [Caenorhabditis sp. 36 PRJEB53466]|nr:unnamed protein product [Caenorhabditis sp. 36 PRJEB53466]
MSGHARQESKKHPADKLKETFEKLNNEVKVLGMILGVKEDESQQPAANVNNEAPKSDDKSQYHKEVSAEDKKARKAAKAAEKKARAEKSVANKAAAATGNAPQKKSEQPEKKSETAEKLVEENERLTKTAEQLTAKMESMAVGGAPKSNGNLKSAIKKLPKESNVRHMHNAHPSAVTFEVSENQVKIVANQSESDETIASDVETTAMTQLEDASGFAHVHPAFLTLMAKAEADKIPDVETVCVEFVIAFKQFLRDWAAEREQNRGDPTTFGHDLDLAIRPQLAHLTQNGHWPLPFALGNTVRLLKRTIKRVSESSNEECEEVLQTYLDDTLQIFSAAFKAISENLVKKIALFKKVVVFDWCPVVNHVLLAAREQMPDLQVYVIDVKRGGKGTRHVESFVERGYKAKYVNLNGASWAALHSSVFVIGCSAIFANGAVAVKKGGLATVLVANHYNLPVIVAAEHFKFVDKIQVYQRVALLGTQDIEFIKSDLVTAVVTDLRILTPTSAPGVLKAKALTDMA